MDADPLALRDLADTAAAAGAAAALPWFQRDNLAVEHKADTSPVTVADREAEAAIKASILAQRPQDGYLGEETGSIAGTTGLRWIVDPIDGTKNFVRGIPLWAVLVACEHAGEVVAAAVHIPGLGERYDAARGHGARWDGRPIRVSSVDRLADALFCYESAQAFREAGLDELFTTLGECTALQRGICDAYGHMLVASGRAEVVLEPALSVWDMAAPSLVVGEAGGRFTDFAGTPGHHGRDAVITNGHLHEGVQALLPA